MKRNTRIHDGLIGALLAASAALALWVDPRLLWLTAATGLIMLQSAFTGFCPVHYLVNKLLPEG